MPKIRLVDAAEWKAAAKGGAPSDLALHKTWTPEIARLTPDEAKAIDAKNPERCIRFTISTAGMDRDFDTVAVDGWNLGNYKKNPVVLWAHDYATPPIARAINTWKGEDRLISVAEFMDADLNPFADMVFRMYDGGWMRAVSVGFVPTAWVFAESADRHYGVDFQAQELLEYSAVPVPSNPAALMDAHKAGVNTAPLKAWAEKVLDLAQPMNGLTRDDLEQAWKALGSQALVIDLKGEDTPEVVVEEPAVEIVPDPAATEEQPAETPAEEPAPDLPVAASCPECAEPLTLSLPVDGAESSVGCKCGAAWSLKSIETIDVLDYEGETFEIEESEAVTLSVPEDFDWSKAAAALVAKPT